MELEQVLKKLKYKDGMHSMAVNVPRGLSEFRVRFPEEKVEDAEFTVLFILDHMEFDRLFKETIGKSRFDSVFWLAYPKKSSKIKTDVTRDTLWESMKPMGYRPVSMISIDDTWSAMRVRPSSEVK